MMEIAATLAGIRDGAAALKEFMETVGAIRGLGGDKAQILHSAIERAAKAEQAIVAANNAIFALQEQYSAVLKERDELAKRVSNFEEHALCAVGYEAFAYVRKEHIAQIEAAPWYCQPCFEQGKKSVLNFVARQFHFNVRKCSLCGAEIKVPNGHNPTFASAGSRMKFDGF